MCDWSAGDGDGARDRGGLVVDMICSFVVVAGASRGGDFVGGRGLWRVLESEAPSLPSLSFCM